jgi:hypothetical protein
VAYLLALESRGMTAVTNLVARVALPDGVTYRAGTTALSLNGGTAWVPLSDDVVETPFPLDGAGFSLGNLAPREQVALRFEVAVDEPACQGDLLVGSAAIESDNAGNTQPSATLDTAEPNPTAVGLTNTDARGLFGSPVNQAILLVLLLVAILLAVLRSLLRLRQGRVARPPGLS